MMKLKREEEKLYIIHEAFTLEPEYAEEANLMRSIKPDWWRNTTHEAITKSIAEGGLWFDMKADGRIVSIASERKPFKLGECTIAHVGVVTIHEHYRRMSYATSVLSKTPRETSDRYRISYRYMDNYPAIKLYEKLGFKYHRSYLFVKAKRK
jgi:predicted GNAT family acetyltransferase